MAVKFYFSAFADEAGKTLLEQTDALKAHGYTHIEPRFLDHGNISDYTENQAKELKEILDYNNLKISAIGSGYGKIEITDDFNTHFEKFKRCIECANILNAKRIRIFSFFFTKGEAFDDYKDDVFEKLDKLSDYSYRNGVLCCHENEKDIYGDNISRCLDILKAFDGKIKAVFDPANFIQCGVRPIEAYEQLKNYIEYFHIKDCIMETGQVVPAGEGDGKIGEILSRYNKEFSRDCIVTLEPHLKVFDGLKDLEKEGGTAEKIKDNYAYSSNRVAFDVAVNALDSVILKEGLLDNFYKNL